MTFFIGQRVQFMHGGALYGFVASIEKEGGRIEIRVDPRDSDLSGFWNRFVPDQMLHERADEWRAVEESPFAADASSYYEALTNVR